MKILVDSAMPMADEVFSQFGEVLRKPGREITADDMRGVDALMVRSVTRVNAKLLAAADNLKFVGTATAGFDHLDLRELAKRGIKWSSAPGNNAASVGDYLLSVILILAQRFDLPLKEMSLGIVGAGHTGQQVRQRLAPLFSEVVLRDPPLCREGIAGVGASLEEILECDIVSLHVPLITDGKDKTYHMLGREELTALNTHHGILINASRGAVVDNAALLAILQDDPNFRVWLDVFEGEPHLTYRDLIPYLCGATAHIAGYALDAKFRATYMVAKAFAEALSLPYEERLYYPLPEISEIDLDHKPADLDLVSRLVFLIYDARRDAALFENRCVDGRSFDLLRRNYRQRRELTTLTIRRAAEEDKELFRALSFTVA